MEAWIDSTVYPGLHVPTYRLLSTHPVHVMMLSSTQVAYSTDEFTCAFTEPNRTGRQL